ncbi:MAG: nucleoside hydrolase [Anaerolineales bacterium]|nr:nucleoside hydrolase [Anaerolineales bacterium]
MNRKQNLLIISVLIISMLAGCSCTSYSLVRPPTVTPENSFFDPPNGKIPVIYSHGGGPCDIGGMVFLTKNPNVDLIGYVLTRGEYHPEIAVINWPIFLLDVLGSKDTAIALGSDERMDPNPHEFPDVWRNASDNFWGLSLPNQETEFEVGEGPDLIIDLVNGSRKKVTILAMASMIDVALALQMDPGIIDNIAHVVIMGGAFNMPGNLDEGPDFTTNLAAEWNMYIDAAAAQYVFKSGVPVSVIPLDGVQYYIQQSDINEIRINIYPRMNYVSQMWDQQWGWAGGGFLIWDTIASTAVTNPENFHWVYGGVDVITKVGDFQGQTIALNDGAQHIRYAKDADYYAIMDQLFETFRGETVLFSPASTLPPTPEPDPIITELAGTWSGHTGDFQIIFYLNAECSLNEICGGFEIPDFSLSGDVTIVDADEDIFEFEVSNLSFVVTSADYEYLQPQDNGTLKYFSSGPDGTSEAVLEKQ